MDLDGTKVSFIETFLGAERTSGLWWLCDPHAQQRELVPVMLARGMEQLKWFGKTAWKGNTWQGSHSPKTREELQAVLW